MQNFKIDPRELEELCVRNRISRLALFGSVLRDDFGPKSDVDVLVEFEENVAIGLFQYARIAHEISEKFFLGRRVDLVTYNGLKPIIKPIILSEAKVQYEKAA